MVLAHLNHRGQSVLEGPLKSTLKLSSDFNSGVVQMPSQTGHQNKYCSVQQDSVSFY